ncbi:DUF6090 family protein [Algibacter mikhailovii]|nr:DUF6090 family protein [Algibacter mikhailovii]
MENKTGKYFKYAIGEIVLVVIGILIALQINNWNENRKSSATELLLLEELDKSLENNKDILSSRIEKFKLIEKEAELLIEHIDAKKEYNDSLASYFSLPLRNFSFRLSYASFENLKSQGFETISNESLRLNIIKLFDEDFGLVLDNENKASDLFIPYTTFLNKHFRTMIENNIVIVIPNDYEYILSSSEYKNIISFTKVLSILFNSRSKEVIERIEILKNEISLEIKSKTK